MTKVLLLRLEGPLQSWGSRARWDVRDTGTAPTKSGIVGLLGCALGYGVGDQRLQKELDAGLRFGYRVERPGSILNDFQTITGNLQTAEGKRREGTIISPRFYLEDAAFLVGLAARDQTSDLLDRCKAALEDPVWPLFLGRKSCIPTRPIFDKLTDEYESLEDALRREEWQQRSGARRPEPEPKDIFVETLGFQSGIGFDTRQEAVRLNAARQYDFITMERIDRQEVQ
jgi:CRISPR system Cascade subunit CasD